MKHLIHIAKDTKDWVRVEAEIKGKYAHQFTDAVMSCNTDNDLKNLILSSILDKYSFFYTKSRRPHKITRLMLELMDDKSFRFYSPSPRDNSLDRSIRHLIESSGLLPTLWKIEALWDKEGVNSFLDYLFYEYQKFKPNSDHFYWLKKHEAQMRLEGKPWDFKASKFTYTMDDE